MDLEIDLNGNNLDFKYISRLKQKRASSSFHKKSTSQQFAQNPNKMGQKNQWKPKFMSEIRDHDINEDLCLEKEKICVDEDASVFRADDPLYSQH